MKATCFIPLQVVYLKMFEVFLTRLFYLFVLYTLVKVLDLKA